MKPIENTIVIFTLILIFTKKDHWLAKQLCISNVNNSNGSQIC